MNRVNARGYRQSGHRIFGKSYLWAQICGASAIVTATQPETQTKIQRGLPTQKVQGERAEAVYVAGCVLVVKTDDGQIEHGLGRNQDGQTEYGRWNQNGGRNSRMSPAEFCVCHSAGWLNTEISLQGLEYNHPDQSNFSWFHWSHAMNLAPARGRHAILLTSPACQST
jgi:hypothetical protein